MNLKLHFILLSYSPADSSDADTSDSQWSLHIPAGADVSYSPHSGKPGDNHNSTVYHHRWTSNCEQTFDGWWVWKEERYSQCKVHLEGWICNSIKETTWSTKMPAQTESFTKCLCNKSGILCNDADSLSFQTALSTFLLVLRFVILNRVNQASEWQLKACTPSWTSVSTRTWSH